jgi:hypothetical protein
MQGGIHEYERDHDYRNGFSRILRDGMGYRSDRGPAIAAVP